MDLELVNLVVNEYKHKKTDKFIILGDFNVEIAKAKLTNKINKRRQKILDKFITTNGLVAADILYTQICQTTYKQKTKRRNTKEKSETWIDHVLVNSTNNTIDQINVRDDASNDSDHNSIEITCRINNTKPKTNEKYRTVTFKTYNWLDVEFRMLYSSKLNELLGKVQPPKYSEVTNAQDNCSTITNHINEIHSCMTRAFNYCTTKLTKRLKFRKTKPWWDNDLKRLKITADMYRKKYRESNYND